MKLEWTARMAVGRSVIDNQHIELFSRFNKLFTTLESGQNKLELIDACRSLESYVAAHMETEEEAMDCYSYSAASAHKAQHAAFETEFASLKEQLLATEINKASTASTLAELAQWQVKHISDMDYDLGRYLRTLTIVRTSTWSPSEKDEQVSAVSEGPRRAAMA